MLQSYLPILVFAFLGLAMGGAFAIANHFIGPQPPGERPGLRAARELL